MNRKEWSSRPGRSSKWCSKRKRAALYARDRYQCVYCESRESLTLDHVIPRVDGGAHHPKNLVTACSWCNSARQGKPLREFIDWLVLELIPTPGGWMFSHSLLREDILRKVRNAQRRKCDGRLSKSYRGKEVVLEEFAG